MAKSYNRYPYWDRYSGDGDHKSKNYTQILAVPGRGEQAAEFTEAQSIQRDYLERLGSAIMSEGTIVDGCVLGVGSDGTVTISSGKIFLEGLVRNVPYSTIKLQGFGSENITARVVTSVVTEDNDSTLRDPAQGYENFGLAGAHREKQDVIYEVNGNGAVLFKFKDGQKINDVTTGETDILTDTLARRTYDENGNYKVYGLSLQNRAGSTKEAPMVSVSNGKAYVQGYEVLKTTVQNLEIEPLNQRKAMRFFKDIPNPVPADPLNISIPKGPISEITEITAEKVVTISSWETTIDDTSRAFSKIHDGSKEYENITKIISIECDGVELSQGIDYTNDGYGVVWITSSSNFNKVGKSMKITFAYIADLILNEDYTLETEFGKSLVKISSSTRNMLSTNSRVSVSYSLLLARKDLITLDSEGNLEVLKGIPDEMENTFVPYNLDAGKLEIGYVVVTPVSQLQEDRLGYKIDPIQFFNYKNVRLTQREMYNLSKRIDDLEYNMAMSDLDKEAEEGESATSLKGIYTDGFLGVTKCDLGYSEVGGDKFNACIDYENEELTLSQNVVANELNIKNSSGYGTMGRIITANFHKNHKVLEQNDYTGIMRVNPYAAYDPACYVKISPAVDNWIETENIEIENVETEVKYNTTYNVISRRHVLWGRFKDFLIHSRTKATLSYEGVTKSSTVTSVMEESMIEYMRVKTVVVEGKSFYVSALDSNIVDEVTCYFNGNRVNLTPIVGNAGVEEGTIRNMPNGYFKASFEIPEKTPCGTVEVKLVGVHAGTNPGTSTGVAQYTAEGTLRTTTTTTDTTITQNYNLLVVTKNHYIVDPLAQSFVFTNDTLLCKVGLYFAEKDGSNNSNDLEKVYGGGRPVIVQIRDVVNGYPGENVLAEVSVDSDDVNVPVDPFGGVPVVTNVEFNQPVYCEAGKFYCVVIMSDSNDYSMYYAKLGGKRSDNSYVTTNPYTSGVLFSSSNSSTWTAHQDSDLKFELYDMWFTTSGRLEFEDVDPFGVGENNVPESTQLLSKILLASEYLDHKNAGLSWEYQLYSNSNNTSNKWDWEDWKPIDAYVERDFNYPACKVKVRARINIKGIGSDGREYNLPDTWNGVSVVDSNGDNVAIERTYAPLLADDCLNILCYNDFLSGCYVSRPITMSSDYYNNVKVAYKANLSGGNSWVKAYIKCVEMGNWIELKTDTDGITREESGFDGTFKEYLWEINSSAIATGGEAIDPGKYKYYRIKLVMGANFFWDRPRIKKLRSIMKIV